MRLKLTISLVCVVLAVLHVAFPGIKVDPVTLFLLVLGVLPWFAPVIKSLELPGGFRIELQDVKAATDKVTAGAGSLGEADPSGVPPTDVADERSSMERLRDLAALEPNLALVGLRIELEKRLAGFAASEGIRPGRRPLGSLLWELERQEKLSPEIASGLNDLAALANSAAHGARVSRDAAEWALDAAPRVFATLAPHDAFVDLWRDLDGVLLRCASFEADSLWDQRALRLVLSRLQKRGLLSSAERQELEALHGLRWDVRVGFGNWYEDAKAKLPRLKELYGLVRRRCAGGRGPDGP